MKLVIRPYRPEDLAALELQDVQRHEKAALLRDPVALVAGGEAWTLLAGGRVRMIAGLAYKTRHRAVAWALIGRNITRREWGKAALKMGARITLLQEFHDLRRVEAETPLYFLKGHKLLVHLGFNFEGLLPAAGPRGEIYAQFARLGGRANLPPPYDALRKLAYSELLKSIVRETEMRRAA